MVQKVKSLLWFLEYHSVPVRMASDKPPTPQAMVTDAAIEQWTGGRLGFGYGRMVKRTCVHCKRTFWSRPPRDICLRWECFKAQKEGRL